MSTPADTSRRPGRPRSERARKAILEAAADLLLDEVATVVLRERGIRLRRRHERGCHPPERPAADLPHPRPDEREQISAL